MLENSRNLHRDHNVQVRFEICDLKHHKNTSQQEKGHHDVSRQHSKDVLNIINALRCFRPPFRIGLRSRTRQGLCWGRLKIQLRHCKRSGRLRKALRALPRCRVASVLRDLGNSDPVHAPYGYKLCVSELQRRCVKGSEETRMKMFSALFYHYTV